MFVRALQYVNTSGLCNRLRALAGIAAVTEILKLPLSMCWRRNWACPASFRELFTDAIPQIPHREANRWRYDRQTLAFYGNHGSRGATRPWRLYFPFVDTKVSVERFEQIAIRHLRSLHPRPEILEQVEACCRDWPARVVGIHVRRLDLPGDHGRRDCELARLIQAESPEAVFIACCDNPQSVQWLRQLLGARLLPRTVQFHPSNNRKQRQTSVAEAVADLYILSKTQRLIGTSGSSFSGYAAELGGIPAVWA